MKNVRTLLALLMALALVAAACGSDDGGDTATETTDSSSSDSASADDAADDAGEEEAMDDEEAMSEDAVEIDYWLWDGNQQPFYQECADAFHAENPGIAVNIEQFGWGDYWDGLTAAFASDSAPDVFTDHLARYPEFVESGVLVPLNDYVEADGLDVTNYFPGLAELWTSPDGDRFGLPKDWDTIAVVINEDMMNDAGLTIDDFNSATWNPTDGGTFGEIIQALTVDANGNRGDSPDFDPDAMDIDAGAVYGFGLEGNFGAFGQTTFSAFAASNGWTATNGPWANSANYGEAALADTIQWFADWIAAGYITPIEDVQSLGGTTMFQGGQAALQTNGSWMISTLSGDATEVPVLYAPTPVGPAGDRASMFNGLADSITTSSEHPDEAWEWVKYMATPACQEIVGGGAVVFPAIPSATKIAQDAHAANGVDVSAFTVHVDNETTFLFPINDSASRVEDAVGPVMEAILRGEADAAESLAAVASDVDSILGS
ncbi:MAG: sugar ABC transporter substrate-binding protein [Actinomycetota bacterium]